MEITKYNSTNFSKKRRSSKSITVLIIHYTGMQSERESIKRLTYPNSKVSSHYLISRNGKIFRLVNDLYIAWHAGKSQWKKYVNLNKNSIGIELVNRGHRYGYQTFPKAQINSLVKLCKKLKKKYKIKNNNILGHSDVAPLRKVDPGEKFPWMYLSTKGLGIYTKLNLTKNRSVKKSENKRFIKNLYRIGYRYLNKGSKKKIIKNFQRRYRQKRINGILDLETLKISEFLSKKTNIS